MRTYNVSEQRRIVLTPEEWQQKPDFKVMVKRAMEMSENNWKGKP